MTVAVIGAGVSGLAVAHELRRRGHRVVVLERQVRAGGSAIAQRIDGFLMEHGPSAVNATVPQAATLSRRLGLDAERAELGPGVRYRYLVADGGLSRIATHPFGFLTADYLSPGARLRLMAEVLVPRRDVGADETIADFCVRRFGREFTARVVDPLVGGLFAGTADGLSMTAVFPTLVDMERRHGSIIRAVARRRRTGATMPGRRLFSWRQGIGTLPRVLAERLGPALKTGIAVRRIRRSAHGFRIETGGAGAFDARAVVLATQPHVAASLLEGIDDRGAEAAASFFAPPIAVVFLGYRRDQVAHPLDGVGYLTPRGEGRALSGAQFCSTMFAGRAPPGYVALAGYMGGARAPELALAAPADLIQLTRAEFRDLLGANGEPLVARVRQWPRGLPQYAPGHDGRVDALVSVGQRQPGLFMTGNYLDGVSVSACLTRSAIAAANVHEFLRGLAHGHGSSVPVRPMAAR